jgi:hypothetical protein
MNDYSKYGEYSTMRGGGESAVPEIGTIAGWMVIGAAVGALLSLLLAPRSGPETREAIAGTINRARRGLSSQALRWRGEVIEGGRGKTQS